MQLYKLEKIMTRFNLIIAVRRFILLMSVFMIIVSTPIVMAETQNDQSSASVLDIFSRKIDQSPSITTELSAVINSKSHPYLAHADFSNRADDLAALYKLVDNKLLWLGNNLAEQNISQVIDLLDAVTESGLNVANYDSNVLREKLPAALNLATHDYKQLALYDAAISLSLLRYLHDLHYGRVNPQGINYNLKLREKKLIDLPTLIANSLKEVSIKQLPLLVEPTLPQYQKLKVALATYKVLAQKTANLQLKAEKSIIPGDSFPQINELRRFLVAVGDMQDEVGSKQSTQYTDKIVKGVKRFQQRHGLGADGVMGKGTIDALNVPLKDRVTQIELAMERLRWLPVFNSGPYIIVNIPAYQLWAFDDIDQNNANITTMKVVVGKALDHQTPVLMAEMRFIDFNPYWNVPYNIFKKELLPKLQQNPGYLEKENMELVATFGNDSKSVTFNSSAIEALKQGNLRIRQRPGKQNALGRIKFMFPNKDDVYLHDTPSRSLFAKTRRDLSHGCVRVADPQRLAEFALKDQWTKDEIQAALNVPKTQRVILKKSIPVLFFYTTAFFDPNNDLVLYSDIYGNDAILIEALKNSEDLSDQAIFVSNNIAS